MHKQIYQPGSLRLVSNNNNVICEAEVKAIMTFPTAHIICTEFTPRTISETIKLLA